MIFLRPKTNKKYVYQVSYSDYFSFDDDLEKNLEKNGITIFPDVMNVKFIASNIKSLQKVFGKYIICSYLELNMERMYERVKRYKW
jgi:hypothetical protein